MRSPAIGSYAPSLFAPFYVGLLLGCKKYKMQLMSTIDGTQDVLTLNVTYVLGSLSVSGSIAWNENP
jgi:hypothetical protein